jgi:hypothetical protein
MQTAPENLQPALYRLIDGSDSSRAYIVVACSDSEAKELARTAENAPNPCQLRVDARVNVPCGGPRFLFTEGTSGFI